MRHRLALVLLASSCGNVEAPARPDGAPGSADARAGQADAHPGQPDAPPGQPDAAPGQPDATIVPHPDAAPGQPDATPKADGPPAGSAKLEFRLNDLTPPNPDSYGTTNTSVPHTYRLKNNGTAASSAITITSSDDKLWAII